MARQSLSRALVTASWLAEAVRAGRVGAGLRVLDASWYPPKERNARQEFKERHIPGASFFDIEECRDKSSPYDFMLPSESHFADYVGGLGVSNDTHVVVYDGDEEMIQNVSSLNFQVVDSRPEGRFRGTELDQGLESGHIPGAVNIPFHSFLSETGHEKSIEEIQAIFREKKVDLSKPLTATCRKGVTACQIALAAFLCGKRDVAVYDGSWSEWFHRAPPHYKVTELKRSKA
ncbi:hypothetical protein EK904_008300 [Melospiza melodia maxima]|nr:hypothetical protein EK904_008300 [Melospiza melodia maxima]